MYWFLLVAGLPCGQVAAPSPTNPPRLLQSPAPADDGEPADDPDIGDVSGLSEVLEALIRTHLPNHYQDQKQWGKTKEVWSGVKVSLDGLRIDSERRHKRVNHGNWKRYRIDLRQPNEQLPLEVANVHETETHRLHFDITTTAPVHVWGEVAKWERGVKLGSISGEADAVVRFRGGFDLGIEFDTSKFPPDVVLRPSVTEAKIEMVSFRLQRLSHLDGPLVKHLGEGLRGVLDNKLERTNATLVAKLNHQIAKKRDKLRWSSSDWMQKKLGLASKEGLNTPRDDATTPTSLGK